MSEITELPTPASSRFKRVRDVTSQVLTLRMGKPRFFFLRGPMYTGKKIDDTKEAATLLDVVDMHSGEYGVHVVTSIERKELNENYPGEGYVGRGFEICITGTKDRPGGHKYNLISIAEVSVPDEILIACKALPPTRNMTNGAKPAAKK